MRISQQQITALGRAIVEALLRADLVELGTTREATAAAIVEQLEGYFRAAAVLDAEAEKMADEHLRAVRGGTVGVDRHRVVQMIKEKLARERDFPL